MNTRRQTIHAHKNIFVLPKGGPRIIHGVGLKPMIHEAKPEVIRESEYAQTFREADGSIVERVKANKVGGFTDVKYQRSNLYLAPPSPIASQGIPNLSGLSITSGKGLVEPKSKIPLSLKKSNRNNIKLIL